MASQPPASTAPAPLLAPKAWRPGWTDWAMTAAAGATAFGLALAGGSTPGAAAGAGGVALVLGALLARRSAGAPDGALPAIPSNRTGPEPVSPPYAEALEALPDPAMLILARELDDVAGRRLTFANAAARELLRVSGDGGPLVSAIRRPEVLDAVDACLLTGAPAEVSYETGGAQDRFWRVCTRPLPAPEEGPWLVLLLMRNETDARRNERMRADFLANASHELRTPLASLAGFIETLSGHARDDPSARDKFLKIMAGQADRMGRLIADLLSLSRIELNEHIPPSGTCDLALCVGDVADALSPQIQDRQLRLDLGLPARGEAVVTGDRDQIVQVVQNLLDNALKYSPIGATVRVDVQPGLTLDRAQATDLRTAQLLDRGGGRMSLLTPDRTEMDRYVVLSVTDPGPGMAREHLPRLSERFYRVEGQKSGERSGTGLGLAIVKHIVNRHRGGLIVESAPGQGAMFKAYFPQAPTAVPVAPPAADPLSGAPPRPSSQAPALVASATKLS